MLTGVVFANSVRENVILFCLNQNSELLSISKTEDGFSVNNSELNDYFKSIKATDLEQWIPFATEDDHDGDIYLNRIYRLYLPENRTKSLSQILEEVASFEIIHSSEKEYIRKPYYTPNDPRYSQQWFLQQVNANYAWNFWDIDGGDNPGNQNVLLASVDTGVDWDHTDLRNNIWQNLNEDADGDGHTIEYSNGTWILDPGDLNGIDDDDWDDSPTTFVDDLIGWDVAGWSGVGDNNPQPKEGVSNWSTWAHGTHVAGLLASSTDNNTGIASVAFDCSIMSVKVSRGNQSGEPYITDGFSGILYAAKAGFNTGSFAIINNSWGGGGFNSYEQANINVAHDTYNAIIFAAGGNGSDSWPYGEEYTAHYPSSYENVIAVAPLGTNDNWNHWGTYHETIDLSSPGENIQSTIIGNNYTSWDGSSMATPIAASCVGLLKSKYPDWSNIQLETMIVATADPVIYNQNSESYLQGRLGTGRVDILKAIETGLFPKLEFIANDIIPVTGQDNDVNPGEIAELRTILVNNEDWGTAVGAIGFLSSESEFVTIINNEASFGTVSPGDATLNEIDPFVIEFSTDTPTGNVSFDLVLTSNEDDYVVYTDTLTFTVRIMPTLDNLSSNRPSEFSLSQNYPNPFNPVTVISYQLPVPSSVLLTIYNLQGQFIGELVSNVSVQEAGYHSVVWDASNYPSGVYFAKLQTDNFTQTQKLLLLK